MNQLMLLELLLAGFFAVACLRARTPLGANEKPSVRNIIRFSGRLDRLRRSRWQWFSIVAVMLVLRLQHQLPPTIELMVGLMFVIFLVCPVKQLVRVSR